MIQAMTLARMSRQGSRRLGTHPVERVALRLSVPETAVRRAIGAVLDRIARMTAADIVDPDAGWQAREDVVKRAAREQFHGVTLQDLVDAAANTPGRPEAPPADRRAFFAGIIHATGGGQEALAEDLAVTLGRWLDLAPEQVDALQRDQLAAELRGEPSWAEQVAQQISVHHMRHVAATASFDDLERSIHVVMMIAAVQNMAVFIGMLDLAGQPAATGTQLDRFDAAMIRQIQQDPMWPETNGLMLSPKPQRFVTDLVLRALGLLISGRLPLWEAYAERLLQITHPPEPTHDV